MSITLRERKSGKVYEIRVSRGRDPETGKQLSPYTMTWAIPENYSAKRAEREARKIEGEFIAKCKAGEVLTKQEEKKKRIEDAEKAKQKKLEDDSKPTFKEYVETYEKLLATRGVALGTIDIYSKTLKRAYSRFEDIKLEDITKKMIRQYLVDLFEEHNFKDSTRVSKYRVFNTFFNVAVEDGVIEYSPMQSFKCPTIGKSGGSEAINPKNKAFDEKEVAYILDCLEKEPFMDKVLITFMLDTGCRRGEVCGLKWESVDLDSGEVVICNNRQYLPHVGVFDTTPKSGNARTLYLSATALNLLREWKQQQIRDLFKKGLRSQYTEGYVFNGKHEEGLHPNALTKLFQIFAKKYDIPDFHPHKLRHTMATLSIANGADVVSVSKKLGHSKPSITLNVYSHANEEAQRRATEVLENAIYKKDKEA